MMRVHRLGALTLGWLLGFVLLTGVAIQLADMRALVSGAPATDRDMLMMRQHINGPPNYAVVSAPDYAAPALPRKLDVGAALSRSARIGRVMAPGATLRFVEVRQTGGRLVGHVKMDDRDLLFDLATGAPLPTADLPPGDPPRGFLSPRGWFKALHRFNFIGQAATALDAVAGMALATMIVTGVAHYVRLLRLRRPAGRAAPFWRAGGGWRTLHRGVAVAAAVPASWIMTTGLALALDNVGAFATGVLQGPPAGPDPFAGDFSRQLLDADIPAMARTTLTAFGRERPGISVKVVRLRWFASYPQGVVIAADPDTSQLVFDTRTGARLAMWEPGYPRLGFPSGWEWHQRLKRLHRGDALGMVGRWIDLLGGLGLTYLLLSGAVLYVGMLRKRRKAGRPGLLWR